MTYECGRRSQRRVTRRRAASLEASSKLEFDDVRVYGDALARPRRGPGRRRRATEPRRCERWKRRRSWTGATGPGLRARLRRTGRPGYRVPPRGQSRLRLQERADGAPGTVIRRQGTPEQGTRRRAIQCPRRTEQQSITEHHRRSRRVRYHAAGAHVPRTRPPAMPHVRADVRVRGDQSPAPRAVLPRPHRPGWMATRRRTRGSEMRIAAASEELVQVGGALQALRVVRRRRGCRRGCRGHSCARFKR